VAILQVLPACMAGYTRVHMCIVCIIVNKSRLNKNAMLKLVGSVNVCLLSNEPVNVQSLFELLNQVAWFLMHVCSGSAIVTIL